MSEDVTRAFPPPAIAEGARAPSRLQSVLTELRPWLLSLAVTGASLLALHLASTYHWLPTRPASALSEVVDVFTCCLLSWKAFTTMLPAFLLGGAIAALVPTQVILRHLGAQANQAKAYAVASISGVILSLCSCNIVPLFVSIYRRGAGMGPAFAFLFAGPAVSIVTVALTFQVIGPLLGVWRLVGVPVIAVLVGGGMALLFRRENAARRQQAAASSTARLATASESQAHVWVLFVLLLSAVVFGAWEMPWTPKTLGMSGLAAALGLLLWRRFTRDEVKEWMTETHGLAKLVLPVLLPAIVVIGALAVYVDVKLVYRLVGPAPSEAGFFGQIRPTLIADLFGALMYFPILTEIAFTKAFLKLGMEIAPALAVLLTGPGLSLPGTIIVARAIGWRKALVYEALVILATAAFALLFGSKVGEYICACMMGH
jgi:uncharacterized membrane protein YraQ (UPF0718 family)